MAGLSEPWWFVFFYGLGYAFSIGGGFFLIEKVTNEMHKTVDAKFDPQHKERPFQWFPREFGLVEATLYTTFWLFKKPEFIGFWLLAKVGARWAIRQRGGNPHRYYPFLMGTVLSVLYGVAGGIIVEWLKREMFYHTIIFALMAVGTFALSKYEKYNREKGNKG